MQYDIVLVLYNSARWLPSCITALANLSYDLTKINVIAVDNCSTDNSTALFTSLTAKHPFGGSFLHSSNKNHGFGAACNAGAQLGSAPLLFFINVDTEIYPDALLELDKAMLATPLAGGYECRQLPYEMGHHVNPVTLETPWASGAALVVRRNVFESVCGFDKHLFMYCEDVDLSWRIRAMGHTLCYVPRAVVTHFVLTRENLAESELREYASSHYGRLLLAYKYGQLGTIWAQHKSFLQELKAPKHFNGVRKLFLKNYLRHFLKLWPFLFWRFSNRSLFKQTPYCLEENFCPERGREVLPQPITSANAPLISVVVRTHKRPHVLRGALQSIANQTYSNYEVIVVEDGEDCSRTMVEAEFSYLPLQYFSTGENIGRGRAGNFGLSQASGQYLNFLDDDDYFYPDHLELMAQKAMQNPDADLILGCAMVMKIDVTSTVPYTYTQRALYPMRFDRIDIFTMCQTCQIPIQSAIFKKSLFEAQGGLREDIHGHEDWAMWMRYLAAGKRANPKHIDIHRATSIFVLPANEKEEQDRIEKYRIYDKTFFNDPSVTFTLSMADMRGFYDDIIADTLHLKNTGKLEEYLAQQKHVRNWPQDEQS